MVYLLGGEYVRQDADRDRYHGADGKFRGGETLGRGDIVQLEASDINGDLRRAGAVTSAHEDIRAKLAREKDASTDGDNCTNANATGLVGVDELPVNADDNLDIVRIIALQLAAASAGVANVANAEGYRERKAVATDGKIIAGVAGFQDGGRGQRTCGGDKLWQQRRNDRNSE